MNNYVTKKEVQEKLNQYIDNLILNQKNDYNYYVKI